MMILLAVMHMALLFLVRKLHLLRTLILPIMSYIIWTLEQAKPLVLNGNVKTWRVENNMIHDVNNISIDVIGFEEVCLDCSSADGSEDYTNAKNRNNLNQARNGLIKGNIVFEMTSSENLAYAPDAYSAACIYVDGGRDVVIEQNKVFDCDLGIELASEHPSKYTNNITLRNNFVFWNHIAGIGIGSSNLGDDPPGLAKNINIIHNTLFDNDILGHGNGKFICSTVLKILRYKIILSILIQNQNPMV